MDFEIKLELRRTLHKCCDDNFAQDFIPMAESFYAKLFELADFPFVTEVIKERRLFVERATKYFILNRQPISVLKKVSNKFRYTDKQSYKELESYILKLTNLALQCHRPYELTRNFSNEFQVKFYDVFKYAFEDKYLTYSEFDRNIEKLYYSNKHSK